MQAIVCVEVLSSLDPSCSISHTLAGISIYKHSMMSFGKCHQHCDHVSTGDRDGSSFADLHVGRNEPKDLLHAVSGG